MAAIIRERPRQAVVEADLWRPAGQLAKAAVVGDEIADVDTLPVGREFAQFIAAAAIGADQRLGEREQRIGCLAADIERAAGGVAAHRSRQKRLDGVVDIEQLAALLAAPYFDRRALDRAAQPDP